jgi:branched-chain amino acid aminotransferase
MSMSPKTFAMERLERRTPDAERERKLEDPGFGVHPTDHMVQIRYEEGRGWFDARICAYQELSFNPLTSFIHYGQTIFEGLKAFAQPGGGQALFRVADHGKRFARSAARLAMPELPVELFVESLKLLVRTDAAWVPRGEGQSLYLRPVMVGTDPQILIRASRSYLFFAIACPVGRYFSSGTQPVNVWISHEYVRAARGGTGAAKSAGNYAASLVAQRQAVEQGCEQVIWLDACERKYVEELGGMNLFFVLRDGEKTRLVTPGLGDTVLAGITRDSIIRLAADSGVEVEQRPLPLAECIDGIRTGRLVEAFACGTGAVIAPLGIIRSRDGQWQVHDKDCGPMAGQLRERLLGIQRGTQPDPYGWRQIVS